MKDLEYVGIAFFIFACAAAGWIAIGPVQRFFRQPRGIVMILVIVVVVLAVASYFAEPWCNGYGDICR